VTTTLPVASEVKKDNFRFSKEAVITPHVIDESGYYENETLATYSLVPKTILSCNTKSEDLSYSLQTVLSSVVVGGKKKYVIMKEPLPDVVRYSGNRYQLNPEIIVKKRIFTELYPKKEVFKDGGVEFKIMSVDLVSGTANIEISNNTKTYVDFNGLSLHFGGKVFVASDKEAIPPKSQTVRYVNFGKFYGFSNEIFYAGGGRIATDKKTAQSTMLELGISTKLRIDGKESTFLKTHQYILANIIKQN